MKSLLEEEPTELLGLEEDNDPTESIGFEDQEEEDDPREMMGFGEGEGEEDESLEFGDSEEEDPIELLGLPGTLDVVDGVPRLRVDR